jgi:cytochrome P450
MVSWPLTLLGVLLAGIGYYFLKIQRYKSLARKNGCEPAKKYPHKDPIFGLDLFLQAGKMFSEHTFLPVTFKRYKENGSTFETKTLGTPTICSCEPDNLQSVFATNARNWGVSYRLPALDAYCGKGFLTTDGAEWERSRQLFSHSFVKANITDHTDFEHYVNLLMDRVPKDGSTVDLQHLIFSLVSTMWIDTKHIAP